MAIATRLTERLGVKHPVMLAPMDLVADGKLAATVSRAGGFGIIGGGYGDETWLKRELDALASHSRDAVLLLWPLELEAIRATLDGRLEDALAVTVRLAERGEEIGSPTAGPFSRVAYPSINPSSSRRLSRRQQGAGDRPTRLASS